MSTTQDLVNYYANLLTIQYINKPKAYATIQALVSGLLMPQVTVQQINVDRYLTGGDLVLSYNGVNAASMHFTNSNSIVQAKLRAIPGLESVVVTGDGFNDPPITVTFNGVVPIAPLLVVVSNTFNESTIPAVVTITEVDETLPNAIQNAFNVTTLNGGATAVGTQLDVLGKYAGVTRSANGFTAPITLSDTDFLQLVTMAVIKNISGSSLNDIVSFIYSNFGAYIQVFDHLTMRMSYLIQSGLGSIDLIQLFVKEGVIPRPMGVRLTVIYSDGIDFFGCRAYEAAAPATVNPLNSYSSYNVNWPWLSYANAVG